MVFQGQHMNLIFIILKKNVRSSLQDKYNVSRFRALRWTVNIEGSVNALNFSTSSCLPNRAGSDQTASEEAV